MIRRALLLVALAATTVAAAPRRVLVLPLDGNADPAVRAKLNDKVRELAKSIDGTVTSGTTTFVETATAVGCDPHTPACVDDVIATLSVDELVWGIANTTDGQTVVVVRRATKQTPPHEATATIEASATDDRATGQLGPLFGLAAEPVATPLVGTTAPDDPARNKHMVAIAMTAGGGFLVLIGLILWGNEISVQSDIDAHPARTLADFRELSSLEDRASSYAITGDLLVLGGLLLGGYGGWQLYKDHSQSVTVRPTPMPNGAGVTLEWRGLP